MSFGWKLASHARCKILQPWPHTDVFAMTIREDRNHVVRLLHGFNACGKGRKTRLHTDAASANCRFKLLAGKWQRSGSC